MKFRHRTASLAGWAVWAVTFVFASALPTPTSRDVTLARASRVTPAVQTAQATLAAAMSARDREAREVSASSAGNAKRPSMNDGRDSTRLGLNTLFAVTMVSIVVLPRSTRA